MILGSNADEGSLFILIAYKMVMFPSAWPAMLNALYDEDRVRQLTSRHYADSADSG